jgi:DNA repair protein RecN (Recombination protein N)
VLEELRVSQLGVIEEATVVLQPGLTALTGETGAGKTLLVDAIGLLLGGPADATMVRPDGKEAVIEGRFFTAAERGPEEVILTRVLPATGRSRAYINGRMVAAAQLTEDGGALVDLHGQHAHQSLLSPAAQRRILDSSSGIETSDLAAARHRLRELREAQAQLGGDPRARARELDLARFQLEELDAAGLGDPLEDDALRNEEELLADASGLKQSAEEAWQGLVGDEAVVDQLGTVVAALSGRRLLSGSRERVLTLQQELVETAGEIRALADAAEDDPQRLAEVTDRRHVLTQLRRKYGDTLDVVIAYREEVAGRVSELESFDARAAELDRAIAEAQAELERTELELWKARRAAAPHLADRISTRLVELGMAKARFEVEVADEPGSETVTWKLGANPGEPVLPLSKVASGGELSRTMLAVRLAAGPAGSDGADPTTLVFDEVDAGVGGEAAVAVGRSLADVARDHQVLVVTHLPQVAAFADHHLVVQKEEVGQRTVSTIRLLSDAERVVELSRMLSGSPDSATARRHAAELLSRGQATGSHPVRSRR